MPINASSFAPRPFRHSIVKIHRWLSIGAAAFWLVQAVTGVLLSFHFEIEDALITTEHRPTDFAAVEQRMDALASAGPDAEIHWIWTTAGLPDRYVISYADADGVARRMRIDGGGAIQRDSAANEYSFFELMREIHLTLLSGAIGHWILAVTGVLLVANLVSGLIAAWPRRGFWRKALTPSGKRKGKAIAQLYSWHRAVGLWAVIPALIIAGAGTMILFEHQIEDLIGAGNVTLPANPPEGSGAGFAAAARAATAAIPGSQFVGTTMPSAEDASYYAWVRAPDELFRAYGGSLVIVNANDASIRGAYPATELDPANAFVKSFYPIHTGEFAGLPGRIIAMGIGLWLMTMIMLGVSLWWKRRTGRPSAMSAGGKTLSTSDR